MRSLGHVSNARILQHNLIWAGLYLIAFELLQSSLADRLKRFSTAEIGLTDNGRIKGTHRWRYSIEVLSFEPKHPFRASCFWLVDNGVISEEECLQIDEIRKYRNRVAHELSVFVAEADKAIELERLEQIRVLTLKVERWLLLEVDIPTNPDFDGRNIALEDVSPGRLSFLT